MPEFINTRSTMGDAAAFDACIADTLTELKDDTVTSLGLYALNGRKTLESIEFPALTEVQGYALHKCEGLKTVKLTAADEIGTYAFWECECLSDFQAPHCTKLGNNAFTKSGLGRLNAPEVTTLGTYMGSGTRMSTIDLTALASIGANQFNGAGALTELILRGTSLVTLGNSNAFTGTPIGNGVGYIYVPADLVDTYKGATNWSAKSSQIKSIADYPLAFQNETITDTWAQILAAELDGTYSSKYSVGDIKYVKVGDTKLPMVIVAKDADDLAAGGKAKITWLSLPLLCQHALNPTASVTDGWAACALRTWLRSVIYPQIEETVREAIKSVTKTYRTKSPTDSTLSVTDTVWIPSAREMAGGSGYEAEGCDYTAFFTDNASRIKKSGMFGSATVYYTRSTYNAAGMNIVSTSGAIGNGSSASSSGIVLGFCT